MKRRKNIEQLEAVILAAENADRYDEDSINEIFRIMHTIKGSSAMMLLTASLRWRIKWKIYLFLRERQPAFIDYSALRSGAEGIDFMKVELQKIKNGDPADGEAGQLLQSIENYVTVLKEQTTAAAETAATAAGQLKTPMPAAADSSIYKAVSSFCRRLRDGKYQGLYACCSCRSRWQNCSICPRIWTALTVAELIREKGFTLFCEAISYAELEEILAQTLFLERLELSQLPAAETAAAGAKDGDVPETVAVERTDGTGN